MNDNGPLNDLIETSKTRQVYDNQLRLAKAQFDIDRELQYAGGKFNITPDVLGYLQHCKDSEIDRTVLLDSVGNPILLEGIDDFIEIASDVYHTALNRYYDEVQRLRSTRSVGKMVAIHD